VPTRYPGGWWPGATSREARDRTPGPCAVVMSSRFPILALGFLVGLVLGFTGAAADGDGILGVWVTEPQANDEVAHIEIERDGDRYAGRIVWLSEPNVPPDDPSGLGGQPKTDRSNPDPALRDRPLVGLRLVEGFRFAGSDRWTDGKIYDPSNGKRYNCNMKLLSDGRLKIRGYIGIPLLGRSTFWTRLTPPDDPTDRP